METTSNIAEDVKRTYAEAVKNGQSIEISYRLPYVAVETGINEYFFQGEEADQLIMDAKASPLAWECTVEEIILWQAQGW